MEKRKTKARPRAKTKSNITKVKTVKKRKSTTKKKPTKRTIFKTKINKKGEKVYMTPEGNVIMIMRQRRI